MAVQAALTGHLVLSTLHTNDAPTAISRLLDLGMPAHLIKATLTWGDGPAIGQNPVPRLPQRKYNVIRKPGSSLLGDSQPTQPDNGISARWVVWSVATRDT